MSDPVVVLLLLGGRIARIPVDDEADETYHKGTVCTFTSQPILASLYTLLVLNKFSTVVTGDVIHFAILKF